MVHFNKVTILGTLADDPNFAGSGSDMLGQFMIGTALEFTNKNNVKVTETQWFRVSVFGNMAQTLQNAQLSKDDKIFVDGRLSVFEYTKNGVNKTSLEIFADQFAAVDSTIAPQTGGTKPNPDALRPTTKPINVPNFP